MTSDGYCSDSVMTESLLPLVTIGSLEVFLTKGKLSQQCQISAL